MTLQKTPYYKSLDGLRGVAIALVFMEHFAWKVGHKISAGFYGVDLFFVLSGFLITSILLLPYEGGFKTLYRKFLGRRLLRIFPIYYLTLLVLWLLGLPVVRDNIFWLLTYTYNYAWVLYDIPHTPVNHFWTLAVEEQFYLCWPFIVLPLKNKPSLLLSCLATIIVLGYGQQLCSFVPAFAPYNDVSLFTHMAPLALGGLGAVFAHHYTLPKRLFENKLVEVVVFLMLFVVLLSKEPLKIPLAGLASLFFVLKAAHFRFEIPFIHQFLQHKRVVNVGMLSYGLYVFHLPIAHYCAYLFDPVWARIDFAALGPFENLRHHAWLVQLPLYSFFSYLVARLSYQYLEAPLLKLKNKYFSYS